MAKYQTIELAGVEKSLAAWSASLDSPEAEFRNGAPDTFRIAIVGGHITDDPVFPFEAIVVFRIQRDSVAGAANTFTGGSVEFIGKRVSNPLDLRPANEAVQFQFVNAMYDLEHTLYQQEFSEWTLAAQQGFVFQSELVLFTRLNEAGGLDPITNGEQIEDALQFLLDQYAAQEMTTPFIIGQVDADVPVPSYIGKPMSCADVIVKSLEISPDCRVLFDYSTSLAGVPTPTIHVRRQTGLQAAALALKDGVSHKELRLVPRPDLQARAVVINYKITDVNDGQNVVFYAKDKYGAHGQDNDEDPESGLRVIVEALDLVGSQIKTISAPLETKPLAIVGGTHATKRAWWSDHDTQFKGTRIRFQNQATPPVATQIPNATVVDADTGDAVDLSLYPNEVTDGIIHPWMKLNNGVTQVIARRIRITAAMSYAQYDVDATAGSEIATNGRLLKRYTNKEHHLNELTVTNGVTDTYYERTVIPAEPIPVGLAQKVYEALAQLQYEGQYLKVEASITAGVTMFNKLNLTNGRPEWATMNAQIQAIRKHYGRGTTEVSIGPARHLAGGELLSILRFWRFRYQRFDISTRASGVIAGGPVQITKNSPKRNTTTGLEVPSFNTINSAPDANNKAIALTHDGDGKQFIIQKIDVATGAPVVTSPKILIKQDAIPDVAAGQPQPIVELKKCSLQVGGQTKDVYVLSTDVFTAGGGPNTVHWEGTYDPTKAYTAMAMVRVIAGAAAGVWLTPLGAAVGVVPAWPENASWILIAFGPIATTVCNNGEKIVYVNSTMPV